MAGEYTTQKVRLMTPEEASEHLYLYPATGINAIYAGTTDSGSLSTTPIASDGKILADYLDIMTATPATSAGTPYTLKVDNNRLAFVTGGTTFDESYMKFIIDPNTPSAKIDTKYLPGYVADVVEVPVVSTGYPASGTLCISSVVNGSGNTTYWFLTRDNPTSGAWNLGGGEYGKLYIGENSDDGSIYRTAAGNTSSAIKINGSPYGISEAKTNGVQLTRINNNLAARADLASTTGPGTIQIAASALTSSPTRNVWFGLTDGVLSISANLANAVNAGIAWAAGTQIQYDTLVSAGRPLASIVPTVDWMQSCIDSAIVGVTSATYDTYGIVKIQSDGGITVTSGIISVPDADANTKGLVQIVDTINTSATGNAGKAVTQGGIVSYVGAQLNSYQKTLTPGSGIDINANNVISVKRGGEVLGFNAAGELFVSSATATTMGAVIITNDSSFISAGSAAVDGKPVAVGPVAVSTYVADVINGYTPTFPIATTSTTGAVQLRSIASASATDSSYWVPQTYDVKQYVDTASSTIINNLMNYIMIGGAGIDLVKNTTTTIPSITVNVALLRTETALYIDDITTNNGRLGVHLATDQQLGVMLVGSGLVYAVDGTVSLDRVTTKEEFSVASNSSKAATVAAITGYVTDQIAGQRPITAGAAIDITSRTADNQISVKYAAPLTLNAGGSLTIPYADASTVGVIRLGNGLTSRAGGSGIVDVDIANSAGYVDSSGDNTSGGVVVPLGGVRVVTNGGIAVTSGNLYMQPATDQHLGGVKTAATNTGISVDGNGKIAVDIDTNVMSITGNALTVKPATTTSGGIVKILNDGSLIGNATYNGDVPTASAINNYVASQIAGATVTLSQGYGINLTPTTTGKKTDYTIAANVTAPITFSGGAIAIQTASATANGAIGGAALGAVNIYGLGVRSDFTDLTETKASTVPTESAVRLALNALPYITYEII